MKILNVTVNKVISKNQYGMIFSARMSEGNRNVTCTTRALSASSGDRLTLRGDWVDHTKFGRQFRATKAVKIDPPVDTLEALAKSDMWPSFTVQTHKRHGNVIALGERVSHQTLANQLIGDGCHPGRAIQISNSFRSINQHFACIDLLVKCNIHIERAYEVAKHMGGGAYDKISNNPYAALCSHHVSMEDALRIHAFLGIVPDDYKAVIPLYYRSMTALKSSGSTGVSLEAMSDSISKVINIDPIDVNAIISHRTHTIGSVDTSVIEPLFAKESDVAKKIVTLQSNTSGSHDYKFPDDCILNDAQRKAVLNALSSGVSVITGGPGTGKTTAIKEVISALEENGYDTTVITVSGKAADRASEATGQQAYTIHNFLKMTPVSQNNTEPLHKKAIIIDEASMVDTNLIHQILCSIDKTCKVVLVGDVNQLESIEPGNVLDDIAHSIPNAVTYLSDVKRFDADSNINNFAKAILKGEVFTGKGNGLYTYSSTSDEEQYNTNLAIIQKYLKKHKNVDDLQVISPTWKGINGVNSLNSVIQDMIPRTDENVLLLADKSLYEGDKVIAKGSFKDDRINNGQMFKVKSINYSHNTITLAGDSTDIDVGIDEAGSLGLAFCITGHSSQGSEFKTVLFSVTPAAERFTDRRMPYTIATRAKQNLIITTPSGSLEKMISNPKKSRTTFLKTLIKLEQDKEIQARPLIAPEYDSPSMR